MCPGHGDYNVCIERAYMHCQGITCARSFDMGLTSIEDLKPQYFENTAMDIFINNMKIKYMHYEEKSICMCAE
jgi:hypothetical protein